MKLMLTAAIVASSLLTSGAPAEVGRKLPELDALKWYNTPALTMEALHGKAVLVEVFRTW